MTKQNDKRNEYARKWRAANAEKVRAQARARYAADPTVLREKARVRSSAWYATNREEVLAESKAWREANREESRRMSREWRAANPEKLRGLHLKYKYGITAEQWDAMFAAQGSCCAACRSADPKHKRGWHTDHDHNTGAVRGILCHRCNVTLGNLGDDASGVARGCAQLGRYLAGPHLNPRSLPAHAGLLFAL